MPEDLCAQHIPYPMHTISYAENIPPFSDEKQIQLKGLDGPAHPLNAAVQKQLPAAYQQHRIRHCHP